MPKEEQAQEMQSQSGNRTNNRTCENIFSHAAKLPLGRNRHTNQCLDGCNGLDFEEMDGKTERKFFAIYFSTVVPQRSIVYRCLKWNY